MGPDDIRRLHRVRPFQPFRLHLSDGASHDVRGPELLAVGDRTSALAVPATGEDDLVLLSNLHITHAEPLPQAAPQG